MIIEFTDRAEYWPDDEYTVTLLSSGELGVEKDTQFGGVRVRCYKDWISVQTDDSPDPQLVILSDNQINPLDSSVRRAKKWVAAGGK